MVEVAMKLHSLKSLGFNLKIEDLFDEEGFSLSEVNRALRKPIQETSQVRGEGGGGRGEGGGGGGNVAVSRTCIYTVYSLILRVEQQTMCIS